MERFDSLMERFSLGHEADVLLTASFREFTASFSNPTAAFPGLIDLSDLGDRPCDSQALRWACLQYPPKLKPFSTWVSYFHSKGLKIPFHGPQNPPLRAKVSDRSRGNLLGLSPPNPQSQSHHRSNRRACKQVGRFPLHQQARQRVPATKVA